MGSINKPGLAKLNTQSSTLGSASFKATTANKLASSTRSGQSYGIMAQRSAVGTGAIFNVKRYNSASISAQRHALNDNRTVVKNNNVIGTPVAPHTCSGNNGTNKYAAALAVTGMLTKTLGSLTSIKGSSGDTSISRFNNTQKTSGSGDSVSTDQSALSAMKDAKDSTSLRAAIETAQNSRTTLNEQKMQLDSSIGELKQNADTAKSDMDCMKQEVKEQTDVVNGLQKDLKEATNQLNPSKEALEGAKKNLGEAGDAVRTAIQGEQTAKTNLSNAQSDLSNAKTNLASAKQNLASMAPNDPGYAAAQAAVTKAESQVQAAEAKVTQAEQELDKAQNERALAEEQYTKADQAQQKAMDNYNKLEVQVDKLEKTVQEKETELKKQQETLNQLQEKLDSAKGAITKYEDALDKQKALDKDIKKYDSEIKEQQERLTKLEKEEQKELTKTGNDVTNILGKIGSRNDTIDNDNGKTSFKENRAIKKNEKDSAKLNGLQAKQAELQRKVGYTELYKDTSNAQSIGGKIFRTGSYNGETLYMIGAKPVTQEEFEKAKKAAEQSNLS